MKKIILSFLILFSINSFAQDELMKEEPKKVDTAKVEIISISKYGDIRKVIDMGMSYEKEFKDKVLRIWKENVFETGRLEAKFKIKSRKGKIEEVKVVTMSKDPKFKKQSRKFMKKVKSIRLRRVKTRYEFITIKVVLDYLKPVKETRNPKSIYKKNGEQTYNRYIKFLNKKKGYSKNKIQYILNNTKKVTTTQIMLKALYADYVLNEMETADQYYSILINRNLSRFTDNEEGLFLVDYLLREDEYDLILDILKDNTCELLEKPAQDECYYFRAYAMYGIENPEYILSLNFALKNIKEARYLEEKIKEDKEKKRKR